MSNQTAASKIINNYAEALLQFKVSPTDVLSVLDILHCYEDYFVSPSVSRKMKLQVINLLNLHYDPFIIQLCSILLDRDKPSLLCPILEQYIYLCNSLDKVKTLKVTTTIPLDAKQKYLVVNNFKVLLGAKKILINNVVDISLLGGIVAESATNVVSISTRDRMKGFGAGLY
jgi:ATP synthase F1 delta subunit